MDKDNKNRCLRCDGKMRYIGAEKLQLGQTGLLLGMWKNIFAGSLEVNIHICSDCGKIEFYSVSKIEDNKTPQKKCPQCGDAHDFDFPKCPNCKYKY